MLLAVNAGTVIYAGGQWPTGDPDRRILRCGPAVANQCGTGEAFARSQQGGHWALLVVVAWMLMAGNWALLPNEAQWLVGRFIPTLILIGMLVEIGGLAGTPSDNRFGKPAQSVNFLRRRMADYQ